MVPSLCPGMRMGLPRLNLLWTAVLLSFGGNFHYGYQVAILNPTKAVFEHFLNSSLLLHHGRALEEQEYRVLWSVLINILVLGCLLSLPLIPLVANSLGRRAGMAIASSICLFSAVPMVVAHRTVSFLWFGVGRLVYGVGCGLGAGISSLYIHEISADSNRGFFCALTGLWVEVGFGVSAVVGLPMVWGNADKWEWLFVAESFPALCLLLALPLIPDSPKYLLSKGRIAEARHSIATYSLNEFEIDMAMAEIRRELRMECKAMGIGTALKNKDIRKGIALGCLVSFVAEFSGISAIDSFTTYFLMSSGLSHAQAAIGNIGVAMASVLSAVVGVVLMDIFGRRFLLIGTGVALLCVNVVFLVGFQVLEMVGPYPAAPYVFLTASCCFMLFVSVGLGPVEWFLVGELVPQNARGAATALGHGSLYVSVFIAGMLFLPLEGAIGAYTFLIFIIPLAAGVVIIYFYLPETKNRSIAEIMVQLNPNYDPNILDETEPIVRDISIRLQQ